MCCCLRVRDIVPDKGVRVEEAAERGQEKPYAERLRAGPNAGHGGVGSDAGSESRPDRSMVSGAASSLWCTWTRVAPSLAEQVNRSTRGCVRKIR